MSFNKANVSRVRWLIFIIAGLLAVAGSFALDEVVDGWAYRPTHDTAWQVAFELSKYGDWPPVLLAGMGVAAGLAFGRKFTWARLLLLVLVAGLLTGLAATVIRSTTGRTRPLAKAPQGFYGLRHDGHWIVGKYEFASFPSGHTAVWAGLAGAAWFRQRRLALGFLVVAVVVAWARLALGCHHLSDVMASIFWGLAVGPWMAGLIAKKCKIDTGAGSF